MKLARVAIAVAILSAMAACAVGIIASIRFEQAKQSDLPPQSKP